MSGYVIPKAAAIEKILGTMYGDDLKATPCDDGELASRHVATYIDDKDGLVAVCACDNEFVVYSGAALTMVPKDVAGDMVRSREVTDIVRANFHEVMNICSRLLMSDDSPHLRLDQTLAPDSAAETVSAAGSLANSANFTVDIPGYGSGNIAFRIA